MKQYTNEELKKVCRYIIDNTTRVVEKKYSDFLLQYVLCRHPRFDEKVGCGIDHLEIGYDGCRYNCFYIVRKDGTKCDISFYKSLAQKPKNDNMYHIQRACRLAVWSEIKEMRENTKLPFVCPITGKVVSKYEDFHIDHYDMEFKDVVDKWVEKKGEDFLIAKIHKEYNKELKKRCYFVDDEIEKDFVDFHNKNTHLRAVSVEGNLKKERFLK